MRITVKLIDPKGPLNGIAQVGNQVQKTVNGSASFDVKEPGDYAVRGLAMHRHFESKVVELKGDLEINLQSR